MTAAERATQQQQHQGWTEKAFASLTNQQQEPRLKGEGSMRMDGDSPYQGVATCRHARVVERTCDWRAPNYLTEDGAVGVAVIVRCRAFECEDCGAGIRPPVNPAARAPRCTRPLCDCLSDADAVAIGARPFWNVALPPAMAYAEASEWRAYADLAVASSQEPSA